MPNTPVLKFGVAGVGVMGRNHARVASEMREFDLTTVFDPDTVVADGVAAARGAYEARNARKNQSEARYYEQKSNRTIELARET